MNTKQILSQKNYGDVKMVAKIMGVSPANAGLILARQNSKKHAKAIEVLQQIIKAREALMASGN